MRDGKYGEFDGDLGSGGADVAAEIFVGRIPLYNGSVSAMDEILSKTIAYGTDPATCPGETRFCFP